MTVIWGGNYSIVKAALREIPPLPFNALRLAIASLLFLAAIAIDAGRKRGRPPLSAGDWAAIAALGLVGQLVYQLLFIGGLSRTSVANSSLIIGCTPVFVALITTALGHERMPATAWTAVALSAVGIYLVVGPGAALTRASLAGDAMMLGAVICWSAATVGSRPVLARHSPLVVTGYSMAIGSVLFLPFAWADFGTLRWTAVSARAWTALVSSAVFALCVAYMIWYTAVQRIGNTRTSMYSNLVPIAALVVAWLWLGEPIGAAKLVGAAAIIGAVTLARLPRPMPLGPDPG